MAVKNGIYYNRRQNPFTNTNIPKKIKSDEDYTPVTAHLDYSINQGVGVVIAELPEVPDLTQSVRIWIIDGSTISADYTRDTTSDDIPNANHFMTALPDSDRPNLIKLPSNVVGKQVGFEYYGLGQVICAEDYMNFKAQSIELTGEFSSGGNIDIAGTVIGRNGLYTPKTMQCLKSLSSEVETSDINAQQANIAGALSATQANITGAMSVNGKLSCPKNIKGYVITHVVSLNPSPLVIPIDWGEWDEDRTWMYMSFYRYSSTNVDDDEYQDIYAGPAKYFKRHMDEYSSVRLKVGTWIVYVYLIEYC